MLRFAVLFSALPLLAEAPSAATLAWMTGCWEAAGPRSTVEEHWMKPAGGILLGMARTVRDGKAIETEFLSIELRDGGLAYVARPSGQAQAEFRLVRVSATEAVFENLAHDFPQRIIYRAVDGGLHARVESADGKKGQDFAMKAAPCK
jgi:hypothetical protein